MGLNCVLMYKLSVVIVMLFFILHMLKLFKKHVLGLCLPLRASLTFAWFIRMQKYSSPKKKKKCINWFMGHG